MRDFLIGLPEIAQAYRSALPLPSDRLQQTAEGWVRARFKTGSLRCLGVGEEGVVLTDGTLVYKYFHYWKSRERARGVSFLKTLPDRLGGFKTLATVREVVAEDDVVAVVYPYESGEPYSGGHLDDVLAFLRECREARITCRNVHPDNFIVTDSGLRLVDYGSDIRPFTEEDFLHMCRRAFLMYRFYFRTDLKQLMRRALDDPDLPELSGFEHFLHALNPRSKEELLDTVLLDTVQARAPVTLMDYGCGKGKLAERMASWGAEVTAYDPDRAMLEQARARATAVRYLDTAGRDRLLAEGKRFDAVVCSLVLCTIEDRSEFERVLRDLRSLVADSGRVFVAVCNPFHTTVRNTEIQESALPPGVGYAGTFSYNKAITSTGHIRTDVHRPAEEYGKAFLEAGLVVDEISEADGTDTANLRPASDFLVFSLRPVQVQRPKVSLLIKTCLMEWRIIERLVRHQVSQLERPAAFFEKVVLVDSHPGPFARQYEEADPEAHRRPMESLLRDRVVDRVVYAPQEPDVVRDAYRRWFGAEATESHSSSGQQVFATLYGFDVCRGEYVLQLDSDLLIGRLDRDHDYLSEMVRVFEDDADALFVPLSIAKARAAPYTSSNPGGDWRIEVRVCMLHKGRLDSVLPLLNPVEDGQLTLSWHRAFDAFISSTRHHSYRGGDPRTCFIHVPNERKQDVETLLDIIDRIEHGFIPDVQLGHVDLQGEREEWVGPKRDEPFVFIVCGRNVDPGRFRRCFESLLRQRGPSWGAIIVDDASDNGFGSYADMLAAPFRERVTVVRNHRRRGLLRNTWEAVTRYCSDPETVIVTLDADDALIGDDVLERVRMEYGTGADVTVGSMLRLDKQAEYVADFTDPRGKRGANVWQHLRTFKKHLFDAIRAEDLMLDGEWIELGNDWAFMLPIIEMARSPRYIPDLLYVYEPSEQKGRTDVSERERAIGRIVAKPRYRECRLRG